VLCTRSVPSLFYCYHSFEFNDFCQLYCSVDPICNVANDRSSCIVVLGRSNYARIRANAREYASACPLQSNSLIAVRVHTIYARRVNAPSLLSISSTRTDAKYEIMYNFMTWPWPSAATGHWITTNVTWPRFDQQTELVGHTINIQHSTISDLRAPKS